MAFSPVSFPKINGHELSRTSVSLRMSNLVAGSIVVVGWTALNFESVRAPGLSHGSRSKPQARTRGKVTFPCDLTVYEREWSVMRAFLLRGGAPASLSWSEVAFLLTLTYFEPSMGPAGISAPGFQTVELVGAQVLSAKQAISDSDDQLARSLTLSVMDVLEDGFSSTNERTALG
jgi:hypothetical protein